MTSQVAAQNAGANYWVPHPVLIRGVHQEIPGVATYELAFVDAASAGEYRFAPGQFNMLYIPGCGEIPISLSADPLSRSTWDHTIRRAGNTTRAMERLAVGSTLGLRGPYGTSWPLEQAVGKDVLFIAGGIGLAPLRPAIYHVIANREQFGRVILLYGARSPDTMLYHREFPDWAAQDVEIETTVDRSSSQWQGNVGVVPLLLSRVSGIDSQHAMAMICGPEVMMRFTVRAAHDLGIKHEQIWVSMERNMQCAVGICGHCQLGPAFICHDGPVFRYDAIAPYLSVEGL